MTLKIDRVKIIFQRVLIKGRLELILASLLCSIFVALNAMAVIFYYTAPSVPLSVELSTNLWLAFITGIADRNFFVGIIVGGLLVTWYSKRKKEIKKE